MDKYDLWLVTVCNFEPELINKCIETFGSAENLYTTNFFDIEKTKLFGLKGPDKSFEKAESLIQRCKEQDIRILSFNDHEYPDLLRHIDCPPRILFTKGEKLNLNKYFCISVVGTRTPSDFGVRYAETLGHDLGKCGMVVVSGMAMGTDGAAHKGALKSGNKTVAVLAGGVDRPYPAINRQLYDQILENGMVISERPPGFSGGKYLYPQRNRILTGLSYATVVCEGKIASGTSISAKMARDNNRDIFAVPGSPVLSNSELPNSLIADGARIVTNTYDIVSSYATLYPELLDNGLSHISGCSKDKISQGDNLEDEIIKFIENNGGFAYINDIINGCNIDIGTLSGKLMLLTIDGVLSQEAGGKYILIGG